MALFGKRGDSSNREKPNDYEAHKERARRRQASQSLAGRDIGELPKVVDPARREACRLDFRGFCENYFPNRFDKPWSEDHFKIIRKIQHAVLEGELAALAMPRGGGKSSLCEVACIWATLHGHRRFVVLIGAEKTIAQELLKSIILELEANEALSADFPEVVYPIRKLERIRQRATGQLYKGRPTRMRVVQDLIVLPTVAESPASGSIMTCMGITGRIRGLKHTLANGFVIRPDLVLIDDPQSRESARSPAQCDHRERIINGDVLGLAGPGKNIAALAAMTVIHDDDVSERLLNKNKNPHWGGERAKLVYEFPTNEKLWNEYESIWRREMEERGRFDAATKFYADHREAMDAGAKVGWEARHGHKELSALQHAMNLRLRHGDEAFFAEYQNEPLKGGLPDEDLLTAEQIREKTNGHVRGAAPVTATRLTAFIDVQEKVLYWLVAAWGDDFSGAVIDYGTEPDQGLIYFTIREARRTLKRAAPGSGFEGSLHAGLDRLTKRILEKPWKRDDGAEMRVERCLVDAGWGQSTDIVYQFCRQSTFSGVLMPSHGRYVGAANTPMGEYQTRPGDRVGLNWRVPTLLGKARRQVRYVLFDANFWKSFVHARLSMRAGDRGSLSLFDDRTGHRLIADHLTAERRTRKQGIGREVDEWHLIDKTRDNHWFDCLVGAAVAASMQGAELATGPANPPPAAKRMSLSELQRRQREKHAGKK